MADYNFAKMKTEEEWLARAERLASNQEYNQKMREFYASQGRPTEAWRVDARDASYELGELKNRYPDAYDKTNLDEAIGKGKAEGIQRFDQNPEVIQVRKAQAKADAELGQARDERGSRRDERDRQPPDDEGNSSGRGCAPFRRACKSR